MYFGVRITHRTRTAAGAIRVNGTVQYFNLEGGFWAVRGDDGVTYDPIAGLVARIST